MRPRLRLVLLLTCLGRAAAGQAAWQPPATVRWPLLDIGIQGDAANGVILMAIPNAAAVQGFESVARSRVDVSIQELRRWLPTARLVLDSAVRLPPLARVAPWGVTLRDAHQRYAFLLGVDPSRKADRVAILQLQDTTSVWQWSAPGPLTSARALLGTLDSVAAVPGTATPEFRSPMDSPGCDGTPAALIAMPRLHTPPRSGWGGRVVLRFMIDSAGIPLDSTVRVLLTSGPQFTTEVHRVFSDLRYRAARCRNGPVPVVVEQAFLLHN